MTPTDIRALAARRALEVALVRAHPTLTDGALEYLAAAGEKTIEWREAVDAGTDFDVQGCVAAACSSEVGQLIFSHIHDDSGSINHAVATANMGPQEKLNYARAHGLI